MRITLCPLRRHGVSARSNIGAVRCFVGARKLTGRVAGRFTHFREKDAKKAPPVKTGAHHQTI